MKILKRVFVCLMILSFGSSVKAQTISSLELDSICDKVESVLGDDWFLTRTETGFEVSFCRSCHEEYIDSINARAYGDLWGFSQERDSFFHPDSLDSISYYPTVSRAYRTFKNGDELRHQQMLKDYAADGTMSFKIEFEKKWSAETYASELANNELLKTEILKEPIYKTSMDIFSDYRFWLPADYFKKRTAAYPFYFKRLPYSSSSINYSIFFTPDKPYFFCAPLYVDKGDPTYYDNEFNQLETERKRTLQVLALALGIEDYRILN